MDSISEISVGLSSVLMASLFAVSASFQFNDTDWYFWIPLYATASTVNLVNGVLKNASTRKMAKFSFLLGFLLFVKVVVEDFVHEMAGFWSFDMRERVVREKFGSGLVMSSMLLHLEYMSSPKLPTQIAKYGMPLLTLVAYGLSFGFFAFQHEEMKF